MIAGFKTRVMADDQVLAELVPALKRRGYEVIGPKVRDGAIVYSPLESADELPKGFADRQEPGSYRLERREDAGWFGYHPGPQSIKQFLHPADLRLFSPDAAPRYAFVGIRACELAAIRIQDRTLVEDRYSDPAYEARRRDLFIVAVNCTTASPDCFCESMKSGPRVDNGFDLALTELDGDSRHLFALEAGTARGADVLEELSGRISSADDDSGKVEQGIEHAVGKARRALTRRVETSGLRELLQDNFEHPQWDSVAMRCLSCANCTMVCPTCFCTTVEDTSDVTGDHAGRLRKWDSCFTQSFSYIHGGSVRSSARSRYRQWLTHKFSYWIDQFGTFGCVGCGRCITWCPAGIDLTAELGAIRETAVLRPVLAKEDMYGNAGTYPGRA